MSRRSSTVHHPNPALASTSAGNTCPCVAMSMPHIPLVPSTLHKHASDANAPLGVHDADPILATTAGPVADATLHNSAHDANMPYSVREVTKPVGPRDSVLSTASDSTMTMRDSITPKAGPRPSNAAFITPAPRALVDMEDLASYLCESFQQKHMRSRDALDSPRSPTQWDPGIPESSAGNYNYGNVSLFRIEMALPATPPLPGCLPTVKSALDLTSIHLGNIQHITDNLVHRCKNVENDILGALQGLQDKAPIALQFLHRIEAIQPADPSSSVPRYRFNSGYDTCWASWK